jgi:hypothetical protein
VRRASRQRGQTLVIAALAMTAMLGALSMVVDAGVYFVIQRQLQNAADAAALDAVWYAPACFQGLGYQAWTDAGCQTSNAQPLPPGCNPFIAPDPCKAAVYAANANLGVAASLCQGPGTSGAIPVQIATSPGTGLNIPSVGTYVVTLSCDAPHWFARVLPGVCQAAMPGCSMRLSASAAAALGWLGQNGQLVGGQTPPPPTPPRTTTPLIARLIL